jgi:site-specific recombinase XerD
MEPATAIRTELAVHFADAVVDFLADLRTQQRSLRTIGEHRKNLARLSGWLDDQGYAWATIRGAQLAGFLRRRSVERPAAVFSELGTLRVFFGWAVEAELIDVSPATGRAFATPRRGEPSPKALSIAQVRELLSYLAEHAGNSVRAHRDQALIVVGLYTGLRAAELAALSWADIRWDEGTLVVVSGKGRKGRVVRLRADVALLLRSWLQAQGRRGTGAVFTVEKRAPLTSNQVGRAVRRYARLLSLPLTTHVLRHTFATHASDRSGDVQSVSRALGHSDLRHTQRYLARMTDGSRRAVESLPGLDGW